MYFTKNYSFKCDKTRKAIFGLQKKLKCVKALTPEIRFDIFDTMIRPIITYGSDVWGLCKSGLHDLHKLFLNYIRCVHCIKPRQAILLSMVNVVNFLQVSTVTRLYFAISTDY